MTALSSTANLEHAPRIGAADLDRRNPRIQTDPAQPFGLMRVQLGEESAGCNFNDLRYVDGSFLARDSTHLRCERRISVESGVTGPRSPQSGMAPR